jgi:uncharacterized protein YegL
VPDVILAGDSFPLQVVVASRQKTSATLQVLRNGAQLVQQQVELAPGRTRIETIVPQADAGRALYEVAVTAAGDSVPGNNRDGVTVDVAAPPNVLIVAGQSVWGEAFAKALAVHDIQATVVAPNRAPAYLKDWLAYSAVVLMNVPAIDLTTNQQELIEKAVVEHGRGLMLLGGENAFGPGGYYETPLERVSPLSSRVPRDAPRVALAFVLDRSGSMQRIEGDASRLDIAKQATTGAIRLLHEESLVSITVFDSEAQTIVPLTQAKNAAAIADALRKLEPGGGTSIYPGLVEALKQLTDVDAMAKHIVVMSDGLSQPADFAPLVKSITDLGITVSSVAIGEGADDTHLSEIARSGKGAFHATRDFKALPSILSKEALLMSGKPVEERMVVPTWADRDAGFLTGLPDRMPPLQGYVLTTSKPEAALHLTVQDSRDETVPILASWRHGNGRVIALATHGAGAWAAGWQTASFYPLMWSQAVRHLVSRPRGEGLRLNVLRRGDELRVAAEVLSPEGEPRKGVTVIASLASDPSGASPASDALAVGPLTLVEGPPGTYRGTLMLDGTGDFLVRAESGSATAEMPLRIAYSALDAVRDPDRDPLIAIAALTAGTGQGAAGGDARWTARPAWHIWLLLALGVFLLDLIIRYAPGVFRLGSRRRAGFSGNAGALPAE